MTDRASLFELPVEKSIRAVKAAWQEGAQGQSIVEVENISASVSTNHVFRVTLDNGSEVIAKTTIYGSYVHFRQDHRIIDQWHWRLANTRYRDLLARTLTLENGDVFTKHFNDVWVVFYEKAPFYDFLPSVLSMGQVRALAEEMAHFHKASTDAAPMLASSWKTLGADVATLYDVLGNESWREERGFNNGINSALRHQCDQFLSNADRLGYHHFAKIPVLIDWNIGNFSVGLDKSGFKLFSRWDYDWFRIEPRMLDFYFLARVVRQEGDQTTFSYTAAPFFEERFLEFLRTYHKIFPLSDEEVLFMKEAYRVFLLNYVIRIGEHFFRHEIWERLQKEALENYFPALEALDFSTLVRALKQ